MDEEIKTLAENLGILPPDLTEACDDTKLLVLLTLQDKLEE